MGRFQLLLWEGKNWSGCGEKRKRRRKERKPFPAISGLLLSCHFTLYTQRWQGARRAEGGSGPLWGRGKEKKERKKTKQHFLFSTQENPGVGDKRCVEGSLIWSFRGETPTETSPDLLWPPLTRSRCWSQMRTTACRSSSSPSTAWTESLRRWPRRPRCCKVRPAPTDPQSSRPISCCLFVSPLNQRTSLSLPSFPKVVCRINNNLHVYCAD